MDEETGLYYYGARHLDSRYSRWISTDPALGEYIPGAGKGNSKDSGSLPGMGGVYNHINFHLYHYAGNNPVKYLDPSGLETIDSTKDIVITVSTSNKTGLGQHVMMLYRDLKNPSQNRMIDADGDYGRSRGRIDNAKCIQPSEGIPLTLGDYINYFLGEKNETLNIYTVKTDSATIKKIVKSMERAERKLPIATCAATASSVMVDSGVFEGMHETCFPKEVMRHLDKQIKMQTENSKLQITKTSMDLSKPETKPSNLGDYY